MGRSIATVQRVDDSLHSPFIELWISHRIEGGTTPEAAQRLALDGTLRNALQRSDVAAFIAFVDSRPAGYLVLSDSTRSLLVDSPCVAIDMLYVAPAYRRLGVGRALLRSVSLYADRQGAEHIASLVPAQDRDANRFFARLGFVP
jgi:GNAT superfamily N-acetyltransferase